MSCCQTNGTGSTTATRSTSVEAAERPPTFQPNVDIYETGDEWVIVADVPGATKEALDLSFDDGILSVAAKVAPRKTGETGYKLREYPIGDFERRFRVGEGVDAGRINATLESGVLTIRLPKAESAKPRKIEIRSN
jgi:HSP20 family protein